MKPTLEEVKEKFKDAEIVECLETNKSLKITEHIVRDFHWFANCVWIDLHPDFYNGESVCLWGKEQGYAKILTYKTPKYEITKEQVLSLHHHGHDLTKTQLEDWFPEVFKKELVVGKWYKQNLTGCKYLVLKLENKYVGFFEEEWLGNIAFGADPENIQEATPQEVESALIGEAKKIGYNNGNYSCLLLPERTHKVKNNYHFNMITNQLFQGRSPQDKNNVVFENGIWATIIETITIQEAEKRMAEQGVNVKIV